MTYLRLPEDPNGTNPGAVARAVFAAGDWRKRHPTLDIGGTWQGVHYMLTEDAWDGPSPASDVVCGGRLLTENGTAELGMDVIYLTPRRVKLAADHLAATKYAAIAGRYEPRRMAELGVQHAEEWARRPAADVRDRELRMAYEGLTRFFEAASAKSEAVYKAMA